MNDGAHVGSVEALDAFRISVGIFTGKSVKILDEASDRAKRTRIWIETDRLPHWQQELKRRVRKLEQAEQEYFSARLTGPDRDLSLQQMMVRKGRRSVEEAEEKIRLIRKWMRDFDQVVEPLVRPISRLRDHLAVHLPKAAASLGRAADALEAYHHGGADPEPAPDAGGPAADTPPAPLSPDPS